MNKIKKALPILVLAPTLLSAQNLRFDPASPATGPFPSDALTIADSRQVTGKRINLPAPQNCLAQPTPSACLDQMMLNQLDGFSLAPRLQVCFTERPTVSTIPNGLFVYPLSQPRQPLRVVQVFYDPDTNCAYGKPESILQQSTQYVLLATNDIRDADGKQFKPAKEFKDCLKGEGAVCSAIANGVARVVGSVPADDRIIGATVFTTMTPRAWLEKARDFVNAPTVPSAVLSPVALNLADLSDVVYNAQVNVNGALQPFPIPVHLLQPHVGRILFASYLSPNFLATSGPLAGSIPPTPTNEFTPPSEPVVIPTLPGFIPQSFHVWLPSSAKPANGYPFVIYGHGLTDNRFGATTTIAATLARHGIATVAMEIQGHGFGLGSNVQMKVSGFPVTIPAPGRGVSVSPDGSIGPLDGCILPGPVATRDCTRQSVVDVMALLRAIQTSGGLGGELDPTKAYIVGQSFGSMFGGIASVIDPRVKLAALNVAGGSPVTIATLQQFHPVAIFYLATRVPSLLNLPFGPGSPLNFDFDNNHVFRGQAPTVNTVPGAAPIQAALEVADWLNMPGDPLAYASGMKRIPMMIQFAKGDWEVPNPTNSALIREAGLRTSSRYFRFDLAKAAAPATLPIQPHRFLANPDILTNADQRAIAIAAQEQVAGFLALNGASIPDANAFLTAPFTGMPLFETPAVLPEELNFPRLPGPPPQLP